MSSSEDESDKVINLNLLPYKSKERYVAVYDNFITWKTEKNITSFSEAIFLNYFEEISSKYKPTSLWAMYSMLKNTLKTKENVNIEYFAKVTEFLKKQSDGYVRKKSKTLTVENVETFIDEAPDDKYLVTKVALILGVTGGLRSRELSGITINQIENHGEMFLVKMPTTEKKLPRTFVIQGKYYNIMKRYRSLRSKKACSNRFFQHYRNGKCSGQVIGKNKFGNMAKEIAEFLKLPEANLYTGHTFRRTSTSLLADGGDTTSKRQSWKSGILETESKTTVGVQERTELGSTESNRTQDPPTMPLEQCCFCGEFTEKYTEVVDKPYIAGNRTTLTINNLNIEVDFNEALPKIVCIICDKKLLEMLDFVKQVKSAQDTLINVTRPIETVIVKNECVDEDDIDNKDIPSDDDDINTMAVCETECQDKSVNRKRKHNGDTPKRPKVTKESVEHEIIIDVKTEPIDETYVKIDIKEEAIENDSENSHFVVDIMEENKYYGKESPDNGDMGTEIKPNEVGLSANLYNSMGDDNT